MVVAVAAAGTQLGVVGETENIGAGRIRNGRDSNKVILNRRRIQNEKYRIDYKRF
jgi:hypothetical protein